MVRSCWSTSTLDCSVSRFMESWQIMAASSAMVGSAMELTEGDGGGGAVVYGGGVDDKDHLEVIPGCQGCRRPRQRGLDYVTRSRGGYEHEGFCLTAQW